MSDGIPILIYAAKRAVFDVLAATLGDVQVSYQFPANPDRLLIYFGAARSARQQGLAEWSSVIQETVTVDVWLRALDPEGDLEAAERSLEQLAGDVVDALVESRNIGPGLAFNDVVFALSPEPVYQPAPDPSVTARLQLQAMYQALTVG